jgi:maleylpyruvate isomerase
VLARQVAGNNVNLLHGDDDRMDDDGCSPKALDLAAGFINHYTDNQQSVKHRSRSMFAMRNAYPSIVEMSEMMVLHNYFASSASYRVRIALNLKKVEVRQVSHHLRKGAQRAPDYLAMNPQGLVPSLVLDDGRVLTQSLAIIEWLDATYPEPPLLPKDEFQRAQVRAFAYMVACDIHPVQNLKVLNRVRKITGDDAMGQVWAKEIIEEGFDACEQVLRAAGTPFAFGDAPTLADICLVPQLVNARRFKVDVERFPRIQEIERNCMKCVAFADAAPAKQPDFEPA